VDRDRRALSFGRLATVAVPLGFLAVFFAWPLLAILERSLVSDGALDVPLDVLTRRSTLEIAWFTLWQATASTALTVAAALPLAWALARFSFRGRSLVEALVLVPFVLPTVVVATAFLAVLPDGLERTVWAILLAHVFFNVAVVVRVVGAYWAGLDRRLDDAAATLGAGPAQRQLRLTLPLLAPALASAASIAPWLPPPVMPIGSKIRLTLSNSPCCSWVSARLVTAAPTLAWLAARSAICAWICWFRFSTSCFWALACASRIRMFTSAPVKLLVRYSSAGRNESSRIARFRIQSCSTSHASSIWCGAGTAFATRMTGVRRCSRSLMRYWRWSS